jgi:hypothetical protein
MSGYKATRSAMGDMARSLERDPQLESILANRKRDLGIRVESGRRLGLELAFSHGIDLGRGRGIAPTLAPDQSRISPRRKSSRRCNGSNAAGAGRRQAAA